MQPYYDHALHAQWTCIYFSSPGNAFLLVANVLYIHRISIDGIRNKTLHSAIDRIMAIDYNYQLVAITLLYVCMYTCIHVHIIMYVCMTYALHYTRNKSCVLEHI